MPIIAVLHALHSLRERYARTRSEHPADQGDVPGWVMVTVMTAALVAALLAIAAPQLTSAFTSAISRIAG